MKKYYDVGTEQDARKVADFIDIAKTYCNLSELEKLKECLETFNRRHGYYCEQQLDDLDSTIYLIKHKNMISQELQEMIAKGQICLDGCQINFGDHCTQNMNHAVKKEATEKAQEDDGDTSLPAVFYTADGVELMEKLKQGNLIDDNLQPISLSWTEKSILVDELSSRLHIEDKWQVFGSLWHLKPQSLRTAYNKAMDMKKTSVIFDRIRDVIAL